MKKFLKMFTAWVAIVGAYDVKVINQDGQESNLTLANLLSKEVAIVGAILALSVLSTIKSTATMTEVVDSTKLVKKSPKMVIFG